jgi:hypothetical protein
VTITKKDDTGDKKEISNILEVGKRSALHWARYSDELAKSDMLALDYHCYPNRRRTPGFIL